MKILPRLFFVFAGLALAVAPILRAAGAAPVARKKVLFFSKSSGFEHDAIKLVMKDGQPGFAFAALREIGEKNNWTNPVFQSVLTGGLNWALGRVAAKVAPNLAMAAPQANVLPKFVEPAPKQKKAGKKTSAKQ